MSDPPPHPKQNKTCLEIACLFVTTEWARLHLKKIYWGNKFLMFLAWDQVRQWSSMYLKMSLQIQSLENWEMTDMQSAGISIQKSWDIKKTMDKNQSERWDVKFWLNWRYGIEKSNCWDGRLIKITNNWYSEDSKIRLKCESVEVHWNPTSKAEIQKELSLRTEIYQYSFNFHSRKLRFENTWICIWCQNLQANVPFAFWWL